MGLANRYALLTVDTEALPKRAEVDHVDRLIWGVHAHGSAGIREMCSIGKDFDAKHIFFVDMCGSYLYPKKMTEVVKWLDDEDQDVQLHLHPEILPKKFWIDSGLDAVPRYMNEYISEDQATKVVRHFSELLSGITRKNVLACRAGSFRWNAHFIRALEVAGISMSFNNSMRAHMAGRSPFGRPTNLPYLWSNGVLEVPVTERRVPAKGRRPERWVSLTYPESSYFPFRTRLFPGAPRFLRSGPSLAVLLTHSWSFLYWNDRRQAVYRDDQRLDEYRNLLARVSRDYDIVTTAEFLDLHARGKISLSPSVDVSRAE
ncbi:polysaccharide deacetylase [Achromobacter sp. ES-001]|uniref:polysaccharide deacetylase n=1 Tax=Achromobacter sp. ES-001 TaxID=2860286 RepID=UPI001C642231|nr:polysaccharide deacetylase [Achromobacter sp. ES-001]QYJ24179.1 polysaccharide deacetylase [Achromobacter sp. ES-001]